MDNRLIGFGLLLAIAAIAFSGGTFSALQASAPTTVSYCGDANWFDQFQDQEGYTPNARCTGVQIEDTRIDVSVSTWDGSWGCHTDYTAYDVENGQLTKLTEFENEETVNGIEVDKSGWRFANYDCQYVQTDYDVSFPGNLTIEAEAAEQVRDGETLDVTIPVTNNFAYPVSGTVSVTLTGSDGSVNRESDVTVSPGRTNTVSFIAPAVELGEGNASISPSFDGRMTEVFNDWEGVNLDCDGDGTIERVEDCRGEGISVTGQGSSADVDIKPPTARTKIERAVEAFQSRVRMAVAVLLNGVGAVDAEEKQQ